MRAFVVFAAGATLAVAAVAADAATPGFQYGVAAGEITPTSAVLWTRSASAGAVNVEVSRSRFFQPQLPLAAAEARVGSDWAVSIRAQNLRPATRYYYRFSRTGSVSPVGTFETALASTSTASVRFAISGDADATAGPNGKPGFNTFGVYARMAAERNDFNINLGDTIYSDSELAGAAVARTVAEKWGLFRRFNSRVATLLARPFAGRETTDPMSGFFALRRETLEGARRTLSRRCGWTMATTSFMRPILLKNRPND